MSVFIVSAGRSGSAWLTAVLTALGLSCRHELYPAIPDTDVVADTGWIWNGKHLLDHIGHRNTPGARDTIIILERPRAEIEASVERLLGERKDWDKLFNNWDELRNRLWRSMTQICKAGYRIQYKDMFDPRFKVTLKSIMSNAGKPVSCEDIDRVWNLFVHLRITNRSVEKETIESYNYGVQN